MGSYPMEWWVLHHASGIRPIFSESPVCDRQEALGKEIFNEMAKAVIYNGYTIQPAPRQLMDTGQWELNVFISWTTEDDEDSRHFVKTSQYATEEEAIAQCITYGQQIIDGKVPGSSVG